MARVVSRRSLPAAGRRRRVGRRAARVPVPASAPGDTVLAAPAHGGGDIDWHTFDPAPRAALAQPDGAGPAERDAQVHALLASPLRYAGHAGRPALGDGGRAGQPRPGRGRALGPRAAARRRVRADLRQRLARRAGRRAVRVAHHRRVGDLHDHLRRALRRQAHRRRSVPTDAGACSRSRTGPATGRRAADPARRRRRAGRPGDRGGALPARRDGEHGVGGRARGAGAVAAAPATAPASATTRRRSAAARSSRRSSTTSCSPACRRAGSRSFRARPATARSISCRDG